MTDISTKIDAADLLKKDFSGEPAYVLPTIEEMRALDEADASYDAAQAALEADALRSHLSGSHEPVEIIRLATHRLDRMTTWRDGVHGVDMLLRRLPDLGNGPCLSLEVLCDQSQLLLRFQCATAPQDHTAETRWEINKAGLLAHREQCPDRGHWVWADITEWHTAAKASR